MSRRYAIAGALILLLIGSAAIGPAFIGEATAIDLPDLLKGAKNAVQGKKGAAKNAGKAAITKGKAATAVTKGKAAIGKNGVGKAAVANTKAGLPKSGVPKSGLTKSAAKSGDPKAGLRKEVNPRLANTKAGGNPKAGLPKSGLAKGGVPKGGTPKGGLPKAAQTKAGPRVATNRISAGRTAIERQRLRVDHRRDILIAHNRLPRRPLPFERGFTGVPPAGEQRFITNEMMFQAGPNVSRAAVEAAAQRHGLTILAFHVSPLTGTPVYHFRVAGTQPLSDVVRAMEADQVGAPQPNYVFTLNQDQQQPPQPQEPDLAAVAAGGTSRGQYVVDKLQLAEVHRIATGNNVLVAVIDSGIDTNHADIAGSIADQYDAVGRAEAPHSHGTGMAGAIVAHQRLLGIAPRAKILAVHAFSTSQRQSAEATTRQILQGLEWAISKGARVVNMSFAGPYDPMIALAMKNAAAKGVVLIAASGNAGPKSPPLYPAADSNVIAVTATDADDKLFNQAVQGPQVAVAAPGVDVMVPAPQDAYQLTTGTSVAAAHVSGVAALLIEHQPNASAQTILEVLTASAKQLDPKGRDDQFGWGLIDPAAALAELDARGADAKVAAAERPATTATTTPPNAAAKKAAPRTPPRPASVTPGTVTAR
jgi:subtilisin family serine protease